MPSKVACTAERATSRVRGASSRARLFERGLGIRESAVGVFDLLAGGDAAVEQIMSARLGGSRVPKARFGAAHLGALAGGRRVERRDLEAHEQIAAPDAIAFRLGNLGDSRRFGSDDDQVGSGRRIDDARRVDDGRGSRRAPRPRSSPARPFP